jgi:2,3-bisphosphoglycerate-dependent phosphoglycerate mutase
MTTVVFVRHAHAISSPDLPQKDWPLSPKGEGQARDLVPTLAALGVNALVSSPYARSIETLRPYAESVGLPTAIDKDLRERALTGGWLADQAAVEAVVRRMFADPDYAQAGGESARVCVARLEAAVARAVAAHPGAVIAIGSHGGILSHLMAAHHRQAPFEFWRAMRNPHVFVFDYAAEPRWIGERTLERA